MKSVLITGASAGFGAAIARRLAKEGYYIIACARRRDKLEQLAAEFGDCIYPLTLDVSNHSDIATLQERMPVSYPTPDVLINNAGLALGIEPAQQCRLDEWFTMIDTNIKGLVDLTHHFLPQMVTRQSGYIINMGSIAGTYPYPGGNIYGASKAFVQQFSLNLRADLAGTGIRVSNIEPGLVGGSEFSNVRFRGDDDKAAALYAGANALQPEDIAETVSWLLSLPRHVNINRIELMPTSQSFSALSVKKQ